MKKARFLGLDVHAETIAVAIAAVAREFRNPAPEPGKWPAPAAKDAKK
jgi:hypothetical protein